MIEFRIRNGPLGGHERILRISLHPDNLAEFTRFLDEIPERNGYNAHLLEYNGRQKHIRQGDISEIRRAIADPCYLERRKVLSAKRLILELLEQRGAMRVGDLSTELGFSRDIVIQAVKELAGRRGYLEFTDDDTVRHKFAEVCNGHAPGPGGPSRLELAEGPDGPGDGEKKEEV